jgi:hypothetical protein
MSKLARRLFIVLAFTFGFVALPSLPQVFGERDASVAEAKGKKSVSVRFYRKKNGTRVSAHKRSRPRR